MPAHDLPYFESAGGQNAGASSVVKAFGLARSRETAWPAAYRRGRAPLAGRHAPPGRRPGASLPGPASLASGAGGRSPGSPPLAAGRGYGGRHLRCHRRGRVGPSPPAPAARCAGPAATRSRSGGDGPSGPGPARLRQRSDRAATGAGLSDARFLGYRGARDVTGRPGRRRSCRHGRREWRAGRPVPRCGQPLVPTDPQSPALIFSNHAVLAGAPLRNRTVDLLLTMDSRTSVDQQ